MADALPLPGTPPTGNSPTTKRSGSPDRITHLRINGKLYVLRGLDDAAGAVGVRLVDILNGVYQLQFGHITFMVPFIHFLLREHRIDLTEYLPKVEALKGLAQLCCSLTLEESVRQVQQLTPQALKELGLTSADVQNYVEAWELCRAPHDERIAQRAAIEQAACDAGIPAAIDVYLNPERIRASGAGCVNEFIAGKVRAALDALRATTADNPPTPEAIESAFSGAAGDAINFFVDEGQVYMIVVDRANAPFGLALTGGFQDADETLEEAAVRECGEELQIAPVRDAENAPSAAVKSKVSLLIPRHFLAQFEPRLFVCQGMRIAVVAREILGAECARQ